MNLQNAEFVISAASERDFPCDGLPQVVFAGRSNAGKSSVLNCVLGRKSLSRVSAQPGKTRHINFFKIDGRAYFVDLPGYGYAKVPESEKRRWGSLIEAYFNKSGLITCGVLIVDIRRRPNEDDGLICDWFFQTGKPLVVAANKADKLSKSALALREAELTGELHLGGNGRLIVFSALKRTGKDLLISEILKNIKQ